jgi:hypothetical protein
MPPIAKPADFVPAQIHRSSAHVKHGVRHFLMTLVTGCRAYASTRQWGCPCPNDVWRGENITPIPNGDECLRPLNMAPLGTRA